MLLVATGGRPGPSISGSWNQVLSHIAQVVAPISPNLGEPRQAERKRQRERERAQSPDSDIWMGRERRQRAEIRQVGQAAVTKTSKLQRRSELSWSARGGGGVEPRQSFSNPGTIGEEKGPCGGKPVTFPSCPTPRTAKNPNGLKLITREEHWAENVPKQETAKGSQSL